MWSPDVQFAKLARLAVAIAMGALVAGCFKPMYAARDDGGSLNATLAGVHIAPAIDRIGQRIRNDLIFDFSGNGQEGGSRYTLALVVTRGLTGVLVQPNRDADVRVLQLSVRFILTEQTSGKVVFSGSTLSRASYEFDRQLFANERALIDAEDRAARTAALDIRTRVAAFLAAQEKPAS